MAEIRLDLFGVIGADFFGEGITAASVAAQLEEPDAAIDVRINSLGGSVFDGVAIYNLLLDHPGPVSVKVLGIAASIASLIAMAADEGALVMAPTAQMLIHEPWTFAMGNAAELRGTAEDLDVAAEAMAAAYMARTGLALAEVRAIMAADKPMGAAETVERGFADAISGQAEAAPAACIDPARLRALRLIRPAAAAMISPDSLAPRKHPGVTLAASLPRPSEIDPMPAAASLALIAGLLACSIDDVEKGVRGVLTARDTSDALAAARLDTITDLEAKLAVHDEAEATRADAEFAAMLDEGQRSGRFSAADRETAGSTLRALGCSTPAALSELPAGVYPAGRHQTSADDDDGIDAPTGVDPASRTRELAASYAAARGDEKHNANDLRRARRDVYGS